MRNTTTSLDDEPCDYQKEGSCLVPGAVESDRDVTCSETLFLRERENCLPESFFVKNLIFFVSVNL